MTVLNHFVIMALFDDLILVHTGNLTVWQQFEYILSMCRNMPDVESLMQEWPQEFEDLLNQVRTVECF